MYNDGELMGSIYTMMDISERTRFYSVWNDNEFIFIVHLASLSMGCEDGWSSFDMPAHPHSIFSQQYLGKCLASDVNDSVICTMLVVASETVLDLLPLRSNLFQVFQDQVEVPSTSLQCLHGHWFGEPETKGGH